MDEAEAVVAEAVVVTPTPTNQAPVFTSLNTITSSWDEATKVHTIIATDSDSDTLVFTIDSSAPLINGFVFDGTNKITFTRASLSSEDQTTLLTANIVKTIKVKVNDGKWHIVSQTITWSINQNNNTPVFTSLSTLTALNTEATKVHTITATDSDSGDTLTFTINGSLPSGFVFDSTDKITFTRANLSSCLVPPTYGKGYL